MKRKVLLILIGVLSILNIYGDENKEVYGLLAPIADMIAENDLENRSIAIGKINDDSGRISVLSNVIADNIETLLVERGKKKKFNVIERENLTKILEEQKLGIMGVVSEDKAVRVGNITGVNIFCFVKYRVLKEKTTLVIKLVDCETGEILSSLTKTIIFPDEITALANKYNELLVEEDMVLVKGGVFDMGRDEKIREVKEYQKNEDNIPMHKVKLSDYYIGKYEVTYSQFEKFVNEAKYMTAYEKYNIENISDIKTYKDGETKGEQPVLELNHSDAVHYCNWLSKKRGYKPAYDEKTEKWIDENGNPTTDVTKVRGYRLPTEAEWEYAAMGGGKSKMYIFSGSNDYNDVGWFISVGTAQIVGMKAPNELGIYDMSGNVYEMCEDLYDKEYYSKSSYENPCNFNLTEENRKIADEGQEIFLRRVLRGGSFRGQIVTTIERWKYMFLDTGFRIVRSK